ncbi:SDR family NAD(P)-dependent oxidoreductase [Parafilimonas sp.]|uniref:SDR family NAD(P)-dependent oxidoreductase n=1 Tax=Parafilimonas sp. TaxID=1969739 RepID=UPI0039E32EE5
MPDTQSKVVIDLTGKTALVTGGTRGIGKAIADKFLDAGATVYVTGTRKEEIDRLNAENKIESLHYLQADFSSEATILQFSNSLSQFERIDILVNNAGINKINLNTETTIEDYNLLTDVNLKAPYAVAKEASKLMKKNGYGRIVNITSIWSAITRPGRSIYTTTKWGIAGLTKTLSVELAAEGVLVNSVGPGFTLTELTANTNTPEEIQKLAEVIPIKRFAQPYEIANLVLFLCSELNSYLTGQNLIIDGGYCNV